MQRGDFETARSDGSACESEDRVAADRSEHRALARHIRSAHDDGLRGVAEYEVIPHAARTWKQRMAKTLANEDRAVFAYRI